jgi:hypothetical protein
MHPDLVRVPVCTVVLTVLIDDATRQPAKESDSMHLYETHGGRIFYVLPRDAAETMFYREFPLGDVSLYLTNGHNREWWRNHIDAASDQADCLLEASSPPLKSSPPQPWGWGAAWSSNPPSTHTLREELPHTNATTAIFIATTDLRALSTTPDPQTPMPKPELKAPPPPKPRPEPAMLKPEPRPKARPMASRPPKPKALPPKPKALPPKPKALPPKPKALPPKPKALPPKRRRHILKLSTGARRHITKLSPVTRIS